MRLIKLSANKESFKTIDFNKTGLSIIVGKKSASNKPDSKKTVNGVGKSLLVELIHFCLGTSPRKYLQIEELRDWEFTLDFEIGQARYSASRKTMDQDVITLNDNAITYSDFNKFLEGKLFEFAPKVPFLSYRGLISYFIRRGKGGYLSYNKPQKHGNSYQIQLNCAFLLGLDVSMCDEKYQARKEMESLRESKNALANIGDKEISDIKLIDIEEKINKLEEQLHSYRVAENYSKIEETNNSISMELNEIENEIFTIQKSIDNINKSLDIKPDIEPTEIISLYKNAQIEIGEMIKEKLETIFAFHNSLLSSRISRFKKEKDKLNDQLTIKKLEQSKLSNKQDELCRYLSEHGALDKFNSLHRMLSDMKEERSSLLNYQKIVKEYAHQQDILSASLAQQNIDTDTYLEEKSTKDMLNRNIQIFRSISKEFYEKKPGAITVNNNRSKNSQVRFDIHAKIQDDTSDGINEVKIFTFDFTILIAKHHHHIDFIMHDSRLYSDMDYRQRSTAFRMAHKISTDLNSQYIVTINEDTLDTIKKGLNEYSGNDNLYDEIVRNNVILELTDESDAEKLLGIQVEINYEAD